MEVSIILVLLVLAGLSLAYDLRLSKQTKLQQRTTARHISAQLDSAITKARWKQLDGITRKGSK